VTSALTQPQVGTIPTANPFTSNIAAAAPGVNLAGNPVTQNMTQGLGGINPGAMPAQPVTAPIKPITGAEGGLMSLPVSHFDQQSYAGGGIVAFGDPALNPNEDQVVPKPSSGFEGILASLPKMEAPVEKTQEQLYAAQKERERLAGVSADPYADSRKRMSAMEERQNKSNEDAGYNRLMQQLSAFATADPAKGVGYAGAVSAQASQALEEKQNALRDKQESAQVEFARAMEKEEDARKRKDSDGIKAALDAQQKAKFDYAKAEHDRGVLAAHVYQTDEYSKARRDAAARADEAKPSAEEKKTLKVQTTVNAHPVVKAIADSVKQGTIQLGSEEYYQALRKINEIARPLYKEAGLKEPEDVAGEILEAPAKKPGLLDRIFGGSSTPAKTSKTVSFNDLPKN
jgi:hypothetical protein